MIEIEIIQYLLRDERHNLSKEQQDNEKNSFFVLITYLESVKKAQKVSSDDKKKIKILWDLKWKQTICHPKNEKIKESNALRWDKATDEEKGFLLEKCQGNAKILLDLLAGGLCRFGWLNELPPSFPVYALGFSKLVVLVANHADLCHWLAGLEKLQIDKLNLFFSNELLYNFLSSLNADNQFSQIKEIINFEYSQIDTIVTRLGVPYLNYLIQKEFLSLSELVSFSEKAISNLKEPHIRRLFVEQDIDSNELESLDTEKIIAESCHPLLTQYAFLPSPQNKDTEEVNQDIQEIYPHREVPIYYNANISLNEFIQSSNYLLMIKQFKYLIHLLEQFTLSIKVPKVKMERRIKRLTIFLEHVESDFFEKDRIIIYGQIKWQLEAIICAFYSKSHSKELKKIVLANMLDVNELTFCSGGVDTITSEAYRAFYIPNNLHALLAEIRTDIIKGVITEILSLLSDEEKEGIYLLNNETHYVNTFCSYFYGKPYYINPGNDSLEGLGKDLQPFLMEQIQLTIREQLTPHKIIESLTRRLFPKIKFLVTEQEDLPLETQEKNVKEMNQWLDVIGSDSLGLECMLKNCPEDLIEERLGYIFERRLFSSAIFDASEIEVIEIDNNIVVEFVRCDPQFTRIQQYNEDMILDFYYTPLTVCENSFIIKQIFEKKPSLAFQLFSNLTLEAELLKSLFIPKKSYEYLIQLNEAFKKERLRYACKQNDSEWIIEILSDEEFLLTRSNVINNLILEPPYSVNNDFIAIKAQCEDISSYKEGIQRALIKGNLREDQKRILQGELLSFLGQEHLIGQLTFFNALINNVSALSDIDESEKIKNNFSSMYMNFFNYNNDNFDIKFSLACLFGMAPSIPIFIEELYNILVPEHEQSTLFFKKNDLCIPSSELAEIKRLSQKILSFLKRGEKVQEIYNTIQNFLVNNPFSAFFFLELMQWRGRISGLTASLSYMLRKAIQDPFDHRASIINKIDIKLVQHLIQDHVTLNEFLVSDFTNQERLALIDRFESKWLVAIFTEFDNILETIKLASFSLQAFKKDDLLEGLSCNTITRLLSLLVPYWTDKFYLLPSLIPKIESTDLIIRIINSISFELLETFLLDLHGFLLSLERLDNKAQDALIKATPEWWVKGCIRTSLKSLDRNEQQIEFFMQTLNLAALYTHKKPLLFMVLEDISSAEEQMFCLKEIPIAEIKNTFFRLNRYKNTALTFSNKIDDAVKVEMLKLSCSEKNKDQYSLFMNCLESLSSLEIIASKEIVQLWIKDTDDLLTFLCLQGRQEIKFFIFKCFYSSPIEQLTLEDMTKILKTCNSIFISEVNLQIQHHLIEKIGSNCIKNWFTSHPSSTISYYPWLMDVISDKENMVLLDKIEREFFISSKWTTSLRALFFVNADKQILTEEYKIYFFKKFHSRCFATHQEITAFFKYIASTKNPTRKMIISLLVDSPIIKLLNTLNLSQLIDNLNLLDEYDRDAVIGFMDVSFINEKISKILLKELSPQQVQAMSLINIKDVLDYSFAFALLKAFPDIKSRMDFILQRKTIFFEPIFYNGRGFVATLELLTLEEIKHVITVFDNFISKRKYKININVMRSSLKIVLCSNIKDAIKMAFFPLYGKAANFDKSTYKNPHLSGEYFYYTKVKENFGEIIKSLSSDEGILAFCNTIKELIGELITEIGLIAMEKFTDNKFKLNFINNFYAGSFWFRSEFKKIFFLLKDEACQVSCIEKNDLYVGSDSSLILEVLQESISDKVQYLFIKKMKLNEGKNNNLFTLYLKNPYEWFLSILNVLKGPTSAEIWINEMGGFICTRIKDELSLLTIFKKINFPKVQYDFLNIFFSNQKDFFNNNIINLDHIILMLQHSISEQVQVFLLDKVKNLWLPSIDSLDKLISGLNILNFNQAKKNLIRSLGLLPNETWLNRGHLPTLEDIKKFFIALGFFKNNIIEQDNNSIVPVENIINLNILATTKEIVTLFMKSIKNEIWQIIISTIQDYEMMLALLPDKSLQLFFMSIFNAEWLIDKMAESNIILTIDNKPIYQEAKSFFENQFSLQGVEERLKKLALKPPKLFGKKEASELEFICFYIKKTLLQRLSETNNRVYGTSLYKEISGLTSSMESARVYMTTAIKAKQIRPIDERILSDLSAIYQEIIVTQRDVLAKIKYFHNLIEKLENPNSKNSYDNFYREYTQQETLKFEEWARQIFLLSLALPTICFNLFSIKKLTFDIICLETHNKDHIKDLLEYRLKTLDSEYDSLKRLVTPLLEPYDISIEIKEKKFSLGNQLTLFFSETAMVSELVLSAYRSFYSLKNNLNCWLENNQSMKLTYKQEN